MNDGFKDNRRAPGDDISQGSSLLNPPHPSNSRYKTQPSLTQPAVPPPAYNHPPYSYVPPSLSNTNSTYSLPPSSKYPPPPSSSHPPPSIAHPHPPTNSSVHPLSRSYPPPSSSNYPPPSSSNHPSQNAYPTSTASNYTSQSYSPPTSSHPSHSGNSYLPPPTSSHHLTSSNYIISPSSADDRKAANTRAPGTRSGSSSETTTGYLYAQSMNANRDVPPTGKYPPRPSSPSGANKATQPAATTSPTRGPNKNSNSRIDPSQMPRPDRGQHDVVYHTRSATTRKTPPTSNSLYTAIDNGNCSPRVMRSTMVAPPGTKEVLSQVGLPFAVICTPFASPEHDETDVPAVDFGELPPRCTRCSTYVNLNVQWLDGGNSWLCNICDMKNATPQWYYASLDASGQRMDRFQRPELQVGSVEFLVNEDYCIRDIQKPIFVFAVDISQKAVANGVTIAAIRAISSCVSRLRVMDDDYQASQQKATAGEVYGDASRGLGSASSITANQGTSFSIANLFSSSSKKGNLSKSSSDSKFKMALERIKVGIITFNHEVQFYSINCSTRTSDPVKMHVCGGGLDPLAPLPPDQWLYPVHAGPDGDQSPIELLLQRLPELIASISCNPIDDADISTTPSESPCCPTAAVQAALDGLRSTGGRLSIITTSHSNSGYGALPRTREKVSLYGTSDEINLYGYNNALSSRGRAIGDTAAAAIASAASIMGGSNPAHLDKSFVQNQASDEFRSSCLEYKAIADECTKSMVCLNIVACVGDDHLDGGAFVDTSLLGDAVLLTGGRLHFMTGGMIREENVYRLEQQLLSDLDQAAASEAVVKLRASIGIRVDSILGPGVYCPVKNESELCGIDEHSTFMFSLSHDSSLKEDEKVHLQLAVLHTTLNCRRKVRVHNLTLLASNKHNVVFRNSDIEAVVVALMKVAVDKALTHPLAEEGKGARAFLDSAVTNALHKYRVHCSPNSSKAQLILPESLKVLPVYTLGMLKHPALQVNTSALGTPNKSTTSSQSLLSSSSNRSTRPLAFIPNYDSALSRVAVRAHERAFELRRLLCSSAVEVINSLYPRIYSVFRLVDDDQSDSRGDSVGTDDQMHDKAAPIAAGATPCDSNLIRLMDTLSPSSEVFESDKMYLVDDRSTLYLYIGRNVPKVIVDVFLNLSSAPHGSSEAASFAVQNDMGRKLSLFVELLRASNPHNQDLRIIWSDLSSSKPLNSRFAVRLIEDSNAGLMSYVDYLCNMHTRIQGLI